MSRVKDNDVAPTEPSENIIKMEHRYRDQELGSRWAERLAEW